MSYSPLNNVTAPDAYTNAIQIVGAFGVRLRILVSNQAIYYRVGQNNAGGGINWNSAEFFLPPGFYSLDETIDALQIRAAIPAAQIPSNEMQAQVSARILTAQEVGNTT